MAYQPGDAPAAPYVAAGFDGYIDTLVRPVRQVDAEGKQYFATIDAFGRYLVGKAALSCSVDLDRQAERPGGNTPLFALALSAMGTPSRCVGAFGWPEPHPAFAGLGGQVRWTGVANPGASTALEFDDGKVMMACNGDLDSFDYTTLRERLGLDGLRQWLGGAAAAAFLNWSEVPGSTSLWKGLQREVLPALPAPPTEEKRWLLLDISDCSRRSAADIREMAGLMRGFGGYFRVAFSLNYNEARVLCGALGVPADTPQAAAEGVLAQTGADFVALHLLGGAVGADAGGLWQADSAKVEKPVLSTGGGDNFNAGLLYALMQGQAPREALAFANRVSRLYVQNGRSPTLAELAAAR